MASGSVTVHYHGCVLCRRRFGCNDAMDKTQTMRGPCISCSSGHEPPIWVTSMDPQSCCPEKASRATKDDLKTYRLAGKGPWFLCRKCYRQFPYHPKDNS